MHSGQKSSKIMDLFTIVEGEARPEELVCEPDIGDGAQQAFVEIICDSPPVLHLCQLPHFLY